MKTTPCAKRLLTYINVHMNTLHYNRKSYKFLQIIKLTKQTGAKLDFICCGYA